jgi:hypothetical protein
MAFFVFYPAENKGIFMAHATSAVQSGQLPVTIQDLPDPCCTKAKIQRLVLYIFSILALCGAAFVAGLVIASVITTPWLWASVALTALGIIGLCCASRIKDYESPRELAQMRNEAHHRTFRDNYCDHGMQNLLQYIAREDGPTIPSLRDKFNSEARASSFSQIRDTYSIDELASSGIINGEFSQLLRSLDQRTKQIEYQYQDQEAQLDHRYSGRTERVQQHIGTASLIGLGATSLIRDQDTRTGVQLGGAALALGGHLLAEHLGADQQRSHDLALGAARGAAMQSLGQVEQAYRNYTARL